MKRKLLLIAMAGLFTLGLNAQEPSTAWEDNIISAEGDTVVIKPLNQGAAINSVFIAIMGDTTSTGERTNPNRVYKTVRGGIYMYDGPAIIDPTVPDLRIVADNGTDQPPLHIKTTNPEGGLTKKFFEYEGDFYAKNQYFCLAMTNNTLDRYAFDPKGEDQLFELDNCILEMTDWTFMSNWMSGISFKLTNCFIHNIGREASLEKGVVIDGASSIRSLYLENNTFVNFGYIVWTRSGAGVADLYVNHNTFVNAAQNPFMTYTQAYQVITNNLFINTNLTPDYPGFYPALEDEDGLPRGIVNIDTVEQYMKDDYFQFEYPVATEAERKMLVDRNNAWWDSKFATMFESQLTAPAAPNSWNDQKIIMNSRTQAMFDDDTEYPYLTEGEWINVEPDFAENADLVDDWVQFIITNAVPDAPNGGNSFPNWRTNLETDLTVVDWPILADLSYTDDALLNAGLNKYPLGDLNWFPQLKSMWENTKEYDALIAARDAGEVPVHYDTVTSGTQDIQMALSNNLSLYPNPSRGVSTLSFNLFKASDVEIIVYNPLGQRVHVQKGYFTKGKNDISLNLSELESGLYILQLNTAYNTAGLTTRFSLVE